MYSFHFSDTDSACSNEVKSIQADECLGEHIGTPMFEESHVYSDDNMSITSEGTDSDSDIIISSSEDEEFSTGIPCNTDEVWSMNDGSTDDAPLYVLPPQQHLYSSTITRSEHVLAVSALCTRHNLSSTAIRDILHFAQIHIPEINIGETSVEKLKDECGFGADYLTYYVYCEICKKLYSDKDDKCKTPDCDGSKSNPESRKYFVTSKLDIQLKEIFERPGVWDSIQETRASKCDSLSDIKSGTGYRNLEAPGGFLHESTNTTLSLFTDGIPLFKSSSVSLWPVYLIINELPPKERFQRKNLILWGIWQGVGKPKMCMFLKPLVLDLIELYTNGTIFTYNEQDVCSKSMVIVATMDLQARAYFLNMTQHNGLHGCLYCMEPGVVLPTGDGRCRAYPFNPTPVLRSEPDARTSASAARISGKRTDGFFGENAFMFLPYFSMTTNVAIDYMHGILLGVCKKFLELWFDTKNSQQAWYIGDKMKIIDTLLRSIKPPNFIHRRPRILTKTYHHWKASELRNWLLFYALPCLKGHLPHVYLVHFSCLVEATYILLGTGISSAELVRSEKLFNAFYANTATLYNSNLMGMNIHNLCHLVDFVKRWGPLWCWSCFAFESFNGEIKKAIHGTGNVCRQVFWHLQAEKRIERKVKDLCIKGSMQSKPCAFLKRMIKTRSSAESSVGESAYKCNVVKVNPLQEDLDTSVKDKIRSMTGSDKRQDFSSVAKVIRNGFKMYNLSCTKVKQHNSYTILMECPEDQAEVIEITKYVMHNDTRKVLAIGRLLIRSDLIIERRVPHLQRLTLVK